MSTRRMNQQRRWLASRAKLLLRPRYLVPTGVALAFLTIGMIATAGRTHAPRDLVGERVEIFFANHDLNRDGVIDRVEFGRKNEEDFSWVDSNQDGVIDREELRAWYEVKDADVNFHAGKNLGRNRGKASIKS